MHGHWQVSDKLYQHAVETCGVAALKSGDGLSAACAHILSQINSAIGGYYGYSLHDEPTTHRT